MTSSTKMFDNMSSRFKQLIVVASVASLLGIIVISSLYNSQYVTDEGLTYPSQYFSQKPEENRAEYFINQTVQEPVLTNASVQSLVDRYDFAITPRTPLWTDKDLQFFSSPAGEAVFSQMSIIAQDHVVPNFVSMTAAERLFKSLFNYFDQKLARNPHYDMQSDPSWTYYNRLEKSLYPWLAPRWDNAFHINNQTQGKGIVICAGNDQFRLAIATVQAVREIHKCDLPIEIFIIDTYDVSRAKIAYYESAFKDVKVRKLYRYVDQYYLRFGGWAMKPFAMLASSFTEVMVMDSDVFFLQSPELLFEDAGYQATGSLFFYDRTLFPDWKQGPDWMRSFLSTMSDFARRTRWFRFKSKHEQESGVVVIDKKKSLLGLLATCSLNSGNNRDQVVYKSSWGDKETFWIGYEIMQTTYAFVKSFGSVIGNYGRGGKDGNTTNICGVMLHMDTNNQPLWFNNGIFRNKHDMSNAEYLNFTMIAQGDNWDFATYCLKDTDKIRPTTPYIRNITQMMVDYDKYNMANRSKLIASKDPDNH